MSTGAPAWRQPNVYPAGNRRVDSPPTKKWTFHSKSGRAQTVVRVRVFEKVDCGLSLQEAKWTFRLRVDSPLSAKKWTADLLTGAIA
jgi:hypothetical protein